MISNAISCLLYTSKSIKAGKRIYYLDVKKNRKDEMFLAITESKKVIMGEGDDSQVSFEKHKIFLYREDCQKFMAGLTEAIYFIDRNDMNDYISRLDVYKRQHLYFTGASGSFMRN